MALLGGYAFERRGEEPLAAPLLRSQLTTMVLGLVIEKPSHGYEIGLRFEDRFAGFLRAGRSSIYPALQRLVHDGLIEKMPAASTMTTARRGAKAGASYRATAKGARAYRAWLAERFRSDPQRVEMLGRMALAGVHSVEAALDFLDRYEQACVREAKTLVPSPDPQSSAATSVITVVERLLVDQRRRTLDAELAWITYARAELRAVKEQPGSATEQLL